MNLSQIKFPENFTDTCFVLIEIPAESEPVKYEIDKESGALIVDRFLKTPMFYPCHYGFVPNTLGGDGDPIDVLVWAPYKLIPGCLIKARIIGGIDMEDEAGEDIKLIAVPDSKISSEFQHIQNVSDLPASIFKKIVHFFEHYKDLEPNKWVKIRSTLSREKAVELLKSSITSD